MELRIFQIVVFCFMVSSACVEYNDDYAAPTNPEDITGWIEGDILISEMAVRLDDNPIGQLAAEAFYHAFDEQVEYLRPDLAIQNSGSIRSEKTGGSLKKGAIKRRVLNEVFKFDEKIYVVEVTYQELKNILEHSVALLPTDNPKGSFLQLYGIEFRADCSRPAERLGPNGERIKNGNRVSDVYVLQRSDGVKKLVEEFPDNKTLRLATSEYLLQGKDGYIDLKNKIDQSNSRMASEKSFEIIARYFVENYPRYSPLSVSPEDNVILINCQ